ncbi:hypothetical protein F503_03437 [Ophiostoma piceae UAMH 11346]|uniref:Tat pathway signal sequence n=1 Tax=Ophiostoma piceae (strain UAMH 11346) TaxID=1262450 RepID=S3D161_OPHP1|nr:hypothetical protein F503_03437 [Ophiostoma piceae UAMH 11346]
MSVQDRALELDAEASMPMLHDEKSKRSDGDESDATFFSSKKPARWLSLAPRISANVPGILVLVGVNLLCWVLMTSFVPTGGILTRIGSSNESDKWEFFSPILKRVKLPFHSQQADASLFPNASHPMAIFSQSPGSEVDKAWERVAKTMMFGLTREDVVQLGKDPDTAVKFSKSWNITSPDGEELYLGVLDVFHQVHCLNMLRKSLITNYDYYYGEVLGFRAELFHETHLKHCTSILLQSIMCHGDVGVYTHVWREGNPVPWPDFGINRQCRDYNALMEFRDKHDVPGSFNKFKYYNETQRAPDAVIFPAEEGLDELQASADEFRDGVYYKDLHIKGCSYD